MKVTRRRMSSLRAHKCDLAFFESLESRLLLSGYAFTLADQGSSTLNGTYLQKLINGQVTISSGEVANHTIQLGDTLILPANLVYYKTTAFSLPNLGGAGTLTIQSSALASLPAGVRVGPSQVAFMPKITTSSGTNIIQTVMSDSYGHSGTPHDYAFIGIEMLPSTDGQTFTSSLIALGDSSTAQNAASLVPYNFTFDRDYIHGWDNVNTNYKNGVSLNCLNATITNCTISNIHNDGQDATAIGGTNGLGNYIIDNNFLEATGENFMQGGGDIRIPNANPTHIVFTNNYVTKRQTWNPSDPSYAGVHMDVKNLFELKNAVDVLVDRNIFENNWVGADQSGFAIVLGGKNQYGSAPWTVVSDVTITNNVFRNVGGGVLMGFDGKTTVGSYTCQPMHDIVIRNNLFEKLDGTGQGAGGGFSISCAKGLPPGWNLTIDHNTVFSSGSIGGFDTGTGTDHQPALSKGFVFTNNVALYAQSGLHTSEGEGTAGMNAFASAITVTNGGSGYVTAPTVVFNNSGTGGSGASAMAFISTDPASVYYKQVVAVGMTNGGSGYVTAPTLTFNNTGTGGSGATATAIIVGGVVKGWTWGGNVIIGPIASNKVDYPAGTLFRDTEDLTGFRDTPGDDFSLLATINGAANTLKNTATDGADPGVNMSLLAPEWIPVDRNLEGYWKFDDGSTGTTALDSTGNGHTGTLSSSSLRTSSGEMNTALAFNGSSGYVSVPTFAAPTAVTLAAWIKPGANTGNAGTIMSKGAGEFILQINSSGYLSATIAGTTLTDTSFNYYAGGNNSKWYLVGATFDPAAGTMALYRSGARVATAANAGTIADSGLAMRIGQDTGGSGTFLGTIDEVRYYTQSLSSNQMNWLYSGFGPLVDGISPGSAKQTGTTSTLSSWALGHADCIPILHQAALSMIFTWSVYDRPAGVPMPTFDSRNGTNAGQDCVVTYYAAGTYNFQLTVTDGLGGMTSTLHALTVIQVAATSVSISPSSATVSTRGTRQFAMIGSSVDQFGRPLTGAWTWSVASGGAGGVIYPDTGLYNAPASAGSDTVNLLYNGTVYASANVTVTGATLASVDVVATGGAGESGNKGTYTFTRTGSTASALTVNFTMGGSATNGVDYNSMGPSVVIPAGSASAAIILTVVNDTLIEGSEKAVLTLTSGTGYALGSAYTGTVGINDNDKPTITISATTPNASETGPTSGVFTVTRAGDYQGTPGEMAVYFSAGGTATNIDDYSAPLTSVVIPAGQMSATIMVTPVVDTLTEGSETVILTLSSDPGYNLGSPSAGTVTIADNDTLPGAPGSLTATPGNNSIALGWSAAPGSLQGYHVERSRDGGAWSLVQTLGPAATNWTDTARSPVPTYSYRLSAYNASGEGPYSNTSGAQALGVLGDGNGDGMVDATDYAEWFNNYGKTSAALSDGDFDGSGTVDATDYALWFNNYGVGESFGAALASADVSAPTQPAGISLIVAGVSIELNSPATTVGTAQPLLPLAAQTAAVGQTGGNLDLLGPVKGRSGGTAASARPRRWALPVTASMDLQAADGLVDIFAQSALVSPAVPV